MFSSFSDGEPKKTKACRRKSKNLQPREDQYEETTISCPFCAELLPARKWNGETAYQHRTEVKTESHGYVLIKTSGMTCAT